MIRVVVASTRREFTQICAALGLNPYTTRYVWAKSAGIRLQLRGFYAEDVYPPEVAAEYGLRKRPSLPVPDFNEVADG